MSNGTAGQRANELLERVIQEELLPESGPLPEWLWAVYYFGVSVHYGLASSVGIYDLGPEGFDAYYNSSAAEIITASLTDTRAPGTGGPAITAHRLAFYLNRAEVTIPSALDHLVNGALSHSCDPPHESDLTNHLFTQWMGTRFLVLETVAASPSLKEMVRRVLKALDDFGSTAQARASLERAADDIGAGTVDEILTESRLRWPTGAEQVAFCISHTNAWKHDPATTLRRRIVDRAMMPGGAVAYGRYRLPLRKVEWIWVLLALEALGKMMKAVSAAVSADQVRCPVCHSRS